jgi:hypothetical protein
LPEKHNTTPQLSQHAGLVMITENLQAFVAAVRANGQIRYGDVRRLQRDILPSGFFCGEDAELLIALNARLVRADRAWTQWLVAAVAAFVAKEEESGHPMKEAAGAWLGQLCAPASTRFGRGMARKIRRAVEPLPDGRAMDADAPSSDTASLCQRTPPRAARADTAKVARAKATSAKAGKAKATKAKATHSKAHKRSPRRATARCPRTPRAGHGAGMRAEAGFGWALPGYLPAVRQGHFMNFPSARVGLVLAPCR